MRLASAVHFVLLLTLFWSGKNWAQTPFQSTGQMFLVFEGTNELVEVIFGSNNNSIQHNTIAPSLPASLNALAFRSTDRMLYAITLTGNELVRIGSDGVMENLGPLPLNSSLRYTGGDISPDGSIFLVVGTDPLTGLTTEFAQIDLNDPSFNTQVTVAGADLSISDLAFDPTSNLIFGFDAVSRTAVNFSLGNFNPNYMTPFEDINNGLGIFLDAFGNLSAYGTTAFGTVDALFRLDETGNESVMTSGSLHPVADLASNSTSVEIAFVPSPAVTLPCGQIEFQFSFANQTGQTLNDLDFIHEMPSGFTLANVILNQMGGNVINTNPEELRIEGLTLGPGLKQLRVSIDVDDLPGDYYPSQGELFGLPFEYGERVLTDDPSSNRIEDSSEVKVNVIALDSLDFDHFFCLDNAPYILTADQFGTNIEWFNGSTSQDFAVNSSGTYTLEANSGCQTVTVTYEVTAATCPFTIELSSAPIPNETFPCSEIIWQYGLENDTGEERNGFTFTDTLPDGFMYQSIVKNPFGGEVMTTFPSQGIRIENMNMETGFDTLEFSVLVGDVAPAQYITRAQLTNLPEALGAIRDSDDPNSPFFDSTSISVLGTLSEFVQIDTHLCPGTEILLNASKLGQSFLWDNGSTDSLILITEPGIFELTVFDGCDPSTIEYNITAAPNITADISPIETTIFLGETVELNTNIFNEDDSLFFVWLDPLDSTLSCLDCTDPIAFPLQSNVYSLLINNEFCQDSVVAIINVDKTRRIYAPNIFSPNGDGINDHFFLQSPDFGEIISFQIFDRWGNKVFESEESQMNQELSGWDGMHRGEKGNLDTYMWRAEIRFLDNLVEEFFGPITLMR